MRKITREEVETGLIVYVAAKTKATIMEKSTYKTNYVVIAFNWAFDVLTEDLDLNYVNIDKLYIDR